MTPSALHRLHSLRVRNEQAAADMDEARPMFDRMRNRHENGTAPRAVTAYQLFQTPEAIAAQMVELLPEAGDAPRILEPSAGLGRLINAALNRWPSAEITAIEEAAQLAGELFHHQAEGLTLLQRDFLAVDPDSLGQFDFVLINPPFHMRADIRHIRHALQFVRPGGTLAALCMNTRHRVEAFQDIADHWQPLPAGTFKESGTNIETILFTITK